MASLAPLFTGPRHSCAKSRRLSRQSTVLGFALWLGDTYRLGFPMFRSRCALLAALWLCTVSTFAADESRVIVVSGDDYCPMSCDPASGHNGLGYDLAKVLFTPLGWDVRYEFLPWQRGLKYFAEGRVDLLPGVPKDDSRELAGAQFAAQAVMTPRMCFYTRVGETWTYQNTDSLLQGRLGVIAGYYYWPELRDYLKAHEQDGTVDIMTSDKAMALSVLRLARKRVDYFAELRPAVEYQLLQQGLRGEIREASCLHNYPLYMAFRPGFSAAAELNRHWDEQLLPFLHSPEGKQMLSKYGLTLHSMFE
jgi:polar amino acid transport system substrate-binding protein